MGNGWYKGRFWTKEKNIFGSEYKLSAIILLQYNNGNEEKIYTDNTWKVKKSKEIMNNIYDNINIYNKKINLKRKINYFFSNLNFLKFFISKGKSSFGISKS